MRRELSKRNRKGMMGNRVKPGEVFILVILILALFLPCPSFPETSEPKEAEKQSGRENSGEAAPEKQGNAGPANPGSEAKIQAAPASPPLKPTPRREEATEDKLNLSSSYALGNPALSSSRASEPFGPEQYFQLLLKRQRLSISSQNQILKILEVHRGDPLSAMKDIRKHEEERRVRTEILVRSFGITLDEYYRSSRGTGEQKERADYLDLHPEVRDELAANSRELEDLEKEVWGRMRTLWSQQAPSP